jgi:hypothetical protein
MTSLEKTEAALNRRLERLQANLRETTSEEARRFLFQSLVVCVGLGEALTDYLKTIGEYAQGRHGALKLGNEELIAQHADLLKSGNELLARLQATPDDRVVRKEIELTQHAMAAIQKNLRRSANALQRDLAPSMAIVDEIAVSVRRLAEADQKDGLKRAIALIVGNARDLYRTQPSLPAKDLIDAAAWENSAESALNQAGDFHEAYARAGYQALLALAAMTMAVSQTPPQTADEMMRHVSGSVAARLKAIAERFTAA